MRTNLIGRSNELELLNQKYLSKKSELAIVYGRRRVGKSALIRHFSEKKDRLLFEGLENQDTASQIEHFTSQLRSQIDNPLLKNVHFEDWHGVFDALTSIFSEQKSKTIVFFDELQWMAANQSKLIALIKYYWDAHWKDLNILLILCGSVASFMVKKVLRSKALYGRFSLQLHVKKLLPHEAKLFFKSSKSNDEILRTLMIFGGVPKYLEELDQKQSLTQNLERLFFAENALYLNELDKIFNVHFKEPRKYLSIIRGLDERAASLEEIAKLLKMKSSGGVKAYLENLELAEFIRPAHQYKSKSAKYSKYRIADEFLYFFSKFVLPHQRIIHAGGGKNLLRNKVSKQLDSWFGFAFENYFINNALYFAEQMGFGDRVESFGPYFKKGEGIQVDLIYYRSDKTISVCEMKFKSEPVSTEVIPQFEAKLKKLPKDKKLSIHKVLIAPNGASRALIQSEYFDLIVTSRELFQGGL